MKGFGYIVVLVLVAASFIDQSEYISTYNLKPSLFPLFMPYFHEAAFSVGAEYFRCRCIEIRPFVLMLKDSPSSVEVWQKFLAMTTNSGHVSFVCP